MTLLVALHGQDGLVLAADSRGTFGDPRGVTAQNDAQQKAHILSAHVAVLTAGAGEIGEIIVAEVKQKVTDGGSDGATNVMNVLRDTVRQNFNDWFPSIAPIPPQALAVTGQVATRPELAFIVCGYDDDGTARLYHLLSQADFAPMLSNYGFAVQGIGQYALYLLNRLYQPERSVEELTALAVYVITETASQDGKVGGPVKVIIVKPGAEGCQALAEDAVRAIENANQDRSAALRDSFFKREVISVADVEAAGH
jgi:20S proteasome alpha/beta subunit